MLYLVNAQLFNTESLCFPFCEQIYEKGVCEFYTVMNIMLSSLKATVSRFVGLKVFWLKFGWLFWVLPYKSRRPGKVF